MGIFDRLLKKKTTSTKALKEEKKKDKVSAGKKEETVSSREKSVVDKAKHPTLKLKSETAAVDDVKEIKAKKIKKTETGSAYRILIKPLITEKATNLVSLNKYAFQVVNKANKIEIGRAIKDLYGLEPLAINIINARGKRIVSGRIKGKKSNWKKAIVTLKPGEKIEIYEGV